jgi:hypothetical protein
MVKELAEGEDVKATILKEHTAILSDHSGQLAEIRVGVQTIIDLLTPRPGSDN